MSLIKDLLSKPAIAGVFPHLFFTFAVLDPSLAIGAWVLLGRSPQEARH
jgi:hypothetical protein